MRPGILCDHSLVIIRQENYVSATQNGEYGAEEGGRCYSCMDTKVLYSRAMGEAECKHCGAREGHHGRGG